MMGTVRALSLLLLCIFGAAYFLKLILLYKKNRIRANVFGKGEKSKIVLRTERRLKIFSFSSVIIWVFNVFFPLYAAKWFIKIYDNLWIGISGLILSLIGVILFIAAMAHMRTSWRVGIDQTTRTDMITGGVYRFSRNPAFLRFDLMFGGMAIAFGNIVTFVITAFLFIALHLQILQEEKFLERAFGKSYAAYRQNTKRYFGWHNP